MSRRHGWWLCIVFLTACSDYWLNGKDDPNHPGGGSGSPGPSDSGLGVPEGGTGGSDGSGWGDGTDGNDGWDGADGGADGTSGADGSGGQDGSDGTDSTDDPPDEVITGCEGATVEWRSGELVVKSWDRQSDSGTLWVSAPGWYHVYDTSVAESGASQRNESIAVRVINATDAAGHSIHANCGADWVAVDPDNGGALPSGAQVYLGTFWFDGGDNSVEMHHACPTIRSGSCTSLEDTTDSHSACDGGSPNSAHLIGTAICLVPAP